MTKEKVVKLRLKLKLIKRVSIYAALTSITIVVIFPFIHMISTSLKPPEEIFTLGIHLIPKRLYWQNYPSIWAKYPFPLFFMNSAIMTIACVVGRTMIGIFAGYAFSKLKWPGRDKVFLIFIASMLLPEQSVLIPVYMMVAKFNWINTYWGLIIPKLADVMAIFLCRQYFLSIPDALLDAAKVDGCGRIRTLFSIIIPLSKPAIATAATFNVVWIWNEFLWPLIITEGYSHATVQIGLNEVLEDAYSQGWYMWGELLAASCFVIIPTIIVFVFTVKTFTKGALSSGLKF